MRNNRQHTRRIAGVGPVSALVIGVLCCAAPPARAQQAGQTPEIVVTATRIQTDIETVGSSVTVIDGEEIERRQLRTMPDVLQSVPGLRVVQLGGPGAQSSVFARGANSNHTLVLIDGLEAGDPSAANGAFNFANLLPENVARIEVVRGPQSTLYGSDAIGAVINIITRKGKGPARLAGRFEGGSNATVNPSISLNGATGSFNYAASASFYRTDGESFTAEAFRPAGVGAEDDGYDNTTVSARFGVEHGKVAETTLFTRFEHVERDSDDVAEDPNSGQEGYHYFVRLESRAELFDGRWMPIFALNHTRYRERFFDDSDAVSTTVRRTRQTGIKNKAELQNNIHVFDGHDVVIGAEVETDYFNQNTRTDFGGFIIAGSSDVNVDSRAIYVQDRFTPFEGLSGTVGVRRDQHQNFGGETTWRATLVYRFAETGTRLKAAAGTGFRAPALFELFGTTANNFGGAFNGNPNLLPEESRGWEAGFEQDFASRRLRLGATYFHNVIENLVVCGITTCANTSNALSYGAEVFIAAEITDSLSTRLDYTFTRAEDSDTDTDLTRRPKHKANFDVTWRPMTPARISLGMTVVGRQRDVGFNGGNVITPGYALLNLSGAYEITADRELYVRADNLLDRNYQVADGFRGRGLFVIFGVRARF